MRNSRPGSVESFDARAVWRITKCEAGAVLRAAAAINRVIDVFAASRVIYCMRAVGGFDHLDHKQVIMQAEAWMRKLAIANASGDTRLRWADPGEMVAAHIRACLSVPVTVKLPDGQLPRLGYCLDRTAMRPAQDRRSPGMAMPVPLLIRCHLPPDPDGRLVRTFADGATVTSWWQGGKLHRDPNDGPAWHGKDAHGERTEWVVNGELHRDPADGPAVVDTNFEGKGIRSEEYFVRGVPHRPSSEGPAQLHIDKEGQRILEIYAERGKVHRDPKEGPAFFQFVSGERRFVIQEYRVHGKLHRDERDGPALLNIHADTGITFYEEYAWQGASHRLGGPSVTRRHANGVLACQHWHRKGRLHRNAGEGPAYIQWREDGSLDYDEYWLHGESIPNPNTARTEQAT